MKIKREANYGKKVFLKILLCIFVVLLLIRVLFVPVLALLFKIDPDNNSEYMAVFTEAALQIPKFEPLYEQFLKDTMFIFEDKLLKTTNSGIKVDYVYPGCVVGITELTYASMQYYNEISAKFLLEFEIRDWKPKECLKCNNDNTSVYYFDTTAARVILRKNETSNSVSEQSFTTVYTVIIRHSYPPETCSPIYEVPKE